MADAGQGAGAAEGQAAAAGDGGDGGGGDALGEGGAKALAAERRAAKQAQRQLAETQQRLQQLEDANKSELQRAVERAEAAEGRAVEAELRGLRVEVAGSKGLPTGMATRLKGSTKEELEADAEELAALLKPAGGSRRDPDQGRGNGHQVAPTDMNALIRQGMRR